MHYKYIIEELKRNKSLFQSTLTGLDNACYSWKVSDDKWSILEILCHLKDEEIEDFKTRLKITLQSPGQIPPSIYPEKWVLERKYSDQSFEDTLEEFLKERSNSIEYLESLDLEKINWSNSFKHKSLGNLNADLFLNNWLAHDYLHIKQITRTKYDYLEHLSKSPLTYAGKWT